MTGGGIIFPTSPVRSIALSGLPRCRVARLPEIVESGVDAITIDVDATQVTAKPLLSERSVVATDVG